MPRSLNNALETLKIQAHCVYYCTNRLRRARGHLCQCCDGKSNRDTSFYFQNRVFDRCFNLRRVYLLLEANCQKLIISINLLYDWSI